jgi:hypothetical protein
MTNSNMRHLHHMLELMDVNCQQHWHWQEPRRSEPKK